MLFKIRKYGEMDNYITEEKKKQKKSPSMMSWLAHRKLGSQLAVAYFVAIVIPLAIIGGYLLKNTYWTQISYRTELLESYTNGVKQTIYEISAQMTALADSIAYNDELIEFLRCEYESDTEVRQAASKITLMDTYMANYAGVEEVVVYIDREDMVNFKQFQVATEEIKETDWYQKAQNQFAPFWISAWLEDSYGNNDWRLALVRKMMLVDGDKEAVIMIKIRNSYLASRINNKAYLTILSVDDMPVVFSSQSENRGLPLEISIEPGKLYDYTDIRERNGENMLYHLSTLDMARTSSDMHLLTYDLKGQDNMTRLLQTYLWVLLSAILLPVVILLFFTRFVIRQVKDLRMEMGKASRGEYEKMKEKLTASEELSAAFDDLLRMVKNIQTMEASQYEAEIRQKNIENEQQKMEFKMLASQINPHFLYNTLESIRMKAFTAGDKEVATAIKLLGKSMRYVLENTGTADTTLKKEYDHIMTYLQIQKLRFGERVNYETDILDGLCMEQLRILPLLLQPIVENAIVHGLEAKESVGWVWLKFYISNQVLYIDISDNGSGMDEETLEKVNHKVQNYTRERHTSSIGLYNINRRIKLNYGEAYGLQVFSTLGKGTKVCVTLPVLEVISEEL